MAKQCGECGGTSSHKVDCPEFGLLTTDNPNDRRLVGNHTTKIAAARDYGDDVMTAAVHGLDLEDECLLLPSYRDLK